MNQVISAVIKEWEASFPNRIGSWYLLGSHVDHSAVRLSDLDLFFVLNDDRTSKEDDAAAERVVKKLQSQFSVPIEVWGQPVGYLLELVEKPTTCELIHTVSIKLGSRHLRGKDIRDQIKLPSIAKYVAALESVAQGWMVGRAKREDDPYLGYCDKSTKRLAQSILSCASALAARRGGIYIRRKSEILDAYRQHVNDDWLPLIEQAHMTLWQEWQYSLPPDDEGCSKLREVCQRTVEFERFALERFSE